MTKHVIIYPEEAADRLAIRELVEAYAHCADRRDAKGQMSLFTDDGGKRRLMVASLRYLDTFVKTDGAWSFAERLLYVDWLEERALS